MIKPTPTKRAVIDVGRKCNINCKFCYHKHLGDLSKQGWESTADLKKQIDSAYYRGCNYIDFTGGEPTINPDICKLIEYALSKGMKSCIITNALCGKNTLKKILDAGIDDFLVSVHGLEEVHDDLTGLKGSRIKQSQFIDNLRELSPEFRVRANVVISSYNEMQIEAIADYLKVFWNPRIVNFINFNPHNDWGFDKEGTKSVIANLDNVESRLNNAIESLESGGVGVNVRYYPMCRIAEKYRKCVCNDLHVVFDPYEWDYCIEHKTPEKYLEHGINMSLNVEQKTYPCSHCNLRFICGGVNKYFYEASEDCVKPVETDIDDMYWFYKYRQNNILTLGGKND